MEVRRVVRGGDEGGGYGEREGRWGRGSPCFAPLPFLLAASSFSPASTSALSIVSLGFLPGFTRLHFVLAILGFRWDALARPPLSKTPAANHRCPLPFGIAYVAKCWARAWQIYWTMCSVSRCGNSPNLHEHSKSEKHPASTGPDSHAQTRTTKLARSKLARPKLARHRTGTPGLARPNSHATHRTRTPPTRTRQTRTPQTRTHQTRTHQTRTRQGPRRLRHPCKMLRV